MTIEELKNKIVNKDTKDIFLVLVNTDESSSYITNQYVTAIQQNNGQSIISVDSLDIVPRYSGFDFEENLYVYRTDKFDKPEEINNCIVICNKTSYKGAVKIPKLLPEQFVDFIQTKVPGMDRVDLEWLATLYEQTDSRVTSVNYYRLENDMDKIQIFPKSMQQKLFNDLYNSGEYNTISNLTVFDLTKALARKDIGTVAQVLKVFDYIDSSPHVWILSILVNNFRNIINVQTSKNQTPESCGLSEKQFYQIKKYSCNYYTEKQLIEIYDMLTDMEYQYKFGGISTDQLQDYMICKILTIQGE